MCMRGYQRRFVTRALREQRLKAGEKEARWRGGEAGTGFGHNAPLPRIAELYSTIRWL